MGMKFSEAGKLSVLTLPGEGRPLLFPLTPAPIAGKRLGVFGSRLDF